MTEAKIMCGRNMSNYKGYESTVNDTYEQMLERSDDKEAIARIYEWAKQSQSWANGSQTQEIIGDICGFAAAFFMVNDRLDLILELSLPLTVRPRKSLKASCLTGT